MALGSSDSVMAWDVRLSRVSIFDMDGTYQRSFSLATDRELGPRQYEALLSDGSILGTTPLSFGAEDGSNGIVRPGRGYARLGRTGDPLADLGQYPGTEAYMRSTSSNVAVLPLPFSRSTVATAWHGRILISPNDCYEIRGYGPTGQLEMILRREHEPLAVSRYPEPGVEPTLWTVFEPAGRIRSFFQTRS